MTIFYDGITIEYNGDNRTITANNSTNTGELIFTSGDQIMITPKSGPIREATQLEIEDAISIYESQVQTDELLGYKLQNGGRPLYYYGYDVITYEAIEYDENNKPQELVDAENSSNAQSTFCRSLLDIVVDYNGVIYGSMLGDWVTLNMHIGNMQDTSSASTVKYLSKDRQIMSELTLDDLISIRGLFVDEIQRIYTEDYDQSIWM